MYDVIIIGAGPAGMAAALYASRSDLKVLLLDNGIAGGQMNNTNEIENYLGFQTVEGTELAQKMLDSALQFGATHSYGNVTNVIDHGETKEVICDDATYTAKVVIIATGSDHSNLNVPGEDTYTGRGVSYCAVCDGAFFRNKHIYVVGGGDSAVDEALYLTNYGSQVTIVHRRDALRAQKVLQDRAFKNEKVDFKWNSVVEEIVGDSDKITGLKLKDTQTGEIAEVDADGLFVYVGLVPLTSAFKDLGITDEKGWIPTDNRMKTSVPGIFAVGDVRTTVLRQVATAVSDGSIAGLEAYNYIETL